MASPAAARRLIGLLLPALLTASTTQAGDDGMLASQRKLAMIGDVETTGTLPPYPPASVRGEEEVSPEAVKAPVSAYRRGALAEGDGLAARIDDLHTAGDGSGGPAGSLDDEIHSALGRLDLEEAAWFVAVEGEEKVGLVLGELVDHEVEVRVWIRPDLRKRGYGTAALRKCRSEMAIYFPADRYTYESDPWNDHSYDKPPTNDYLPWPVQFVKNTTWADFLHEFYGIQP